MRDDGEILGLRFDEPGLSDDRNLIRGLLAAMRFVVPADADSGNGSWAATETDLTGVAEVRYRRQPTAEGIDVTRLGRDYRVEPKRAAATRTGAASAAFSSALGWWRDLRVRAETAVPITELEVVARERLTLTAVVDRVDAVGRPAEPDVWRDTWLPLTPAEPSELARRNKLRGLQKAFAGVRLEDLTARLEQLCRDGAGGSPELTAALRALADLLAVRPHLASVLMQRVVGGELGDAAGRLAIAALGMAGTAPAQAALASALGDAAVPAGARRAALQSMAQLAEPGQVVIAALWRTVDQPASGELGPAALFALGALAPRADEQRGPLAERLLAAAHCGGTTTATWLEALGKAGLPQVLDIAVGHLDSPDAQTRYSAVGALRKLLGHACWRACARWRWRIRRAAGAGGRCGCWRGEPRTRPER